MRDTQAETRNLHLRQVALLNDNLPRRCPLGRKGNLVSGLYDHETEAVPATVNDELLA